jgi:hypothetical protein
LAHRSEEPKVSRCSIFFEPEILQIGLRDVYRMRRSEFSGGEVFFGEAATHGIVIIRKSWSVITKLLTAGHGAQNQT